LAIAREKQLKGYSRLKKNELIDKLNPGWKELNIKGEITIP
jgi:predicted GIY-YIG superfamily endonuclease